MCLLRLSSHYPRRLFTSIPFHKRRVSQCLSLDSKHRRRHPNQSRPKVLQHRVHHVTRRGIRRFVPPAIPPKSRRLPLLLPRPHRPLRGSAPRLDILRNKVEGCAHGVSVARLEEPDARKRREPVQQRDRAPRVQPVEENDHRSTGSDALEGEHELACEESKGLALLAVSDPAMAPCWLRRQEAGSVGADEFIGHLLDRTAGRRG